MGGAQNVKAAGALAGCPAYYMKNIPFVLAANLNIGWCDLESQSGLTKLGHVTLVTTGSQKLTIGLYMKR